LRPVTAYTDHYDENMAKASLNNLQKLGKVGPFDMSQGKVSGDTNSRASQTSQRVKAKHLRGFGSSIDSR
jgi:hypothetical protein